MTIEEVLTRFSGDRFALDAAGVEITAVGEKAAECTVRLRPEHLNSLGRPMGGLIFTLADFCFAVAANADVMGTVSQSANITFLSAAQGETLTLTLYRYDGESCIACVDGEPIAFVSRDKAVDLIEAVRAVTLGA